jgi:CheY-like chemotaxis protein
MKKILVVDDSPDDLFLLKRVFNKLDLGHVVEIANNGEEAIRYLENPDKPRPTMVLLDLHMPKLSGFEVLAWIRGHNDLKHLPVVIFSSSIEPSDLTRAYSLGANGYLEKPSMPGVLETMIQTSSQYWLKWNQSLPTA